MQLKDNYKIISSILIFLSFSSFLLGFYYDENAAGGGMYTGDFKFIWNNLQIFLNNDLSTSIQHPEYLDSRAPTAYILHEWFNPFLDTKIGFRRSVFVISLVLPIVFYLCLKQRFQNQDKLLLILISSIVCLSPFFRTSAYWGLQENYGLIFLLLTFLFFDKFLKNESQQGYKIYLQLFLTIFFSSCALYFDAKLIIIPIICFTKIFLLEKKIQFKIFTFFLYIIFSLPYIYFISEWGSILPLHIVEYRKVGDKLFLDHIGYSSTIIALYFLPLLLFKEKNLQSLIKDFFLSKKNYFLICLFFIYLFYLLGFYEFRELTYIIHRNAYLPPLGSGYIHKVSIILFDSLFLQKIFTYFAFFASWVIILIYIDRNYNNILILLYLLLYPIMLWPILHEYFDPLILLMIFTFFNSKLILNYKNSILLYLYLSLFLILSNIYYSNLLS